MIGDNKNKTSVIELVAIGLVLSLTVFVLSTVILNKQSNDELKAALNKAQSQAAVK